MSLDVYLKGPENAVVCSHCDSTYTERETLYEANITHNLGMMARKAHLYLALWRPDEQGITVAAQLIPLLEDGLKQLEERPDFFKSFNPSNGWGNYDGLVNFTRKYLDACKQNPDAIVVVSR
jgi:hypothetical protein